MSGTSSNTSFFSFGPHDSFISKSFQGLKSRNLSPDLHKLILRKSALDVHWAVLGTVTDSWILSFKDSSGKDALRWGSATPKRLQTILAKTWHSHLLRAFLGPEDSFIVWHPELIRWANLPAALEDTIQSWLTPSGWRVGPPRMVTWGPEGAFFAMSEYGEVAYEFGDGDDEWEIYRETVEEWTAERGFSWNDLAFMALDPTSWDQFVAIRNDGTWAGSIDDVNEDALESFALNCFARARPKQKENPQADEQSSNGISSTKPDAATQALYEQWSAETSAKFTSALIAIANSQPKKLSQSSLHSVTLSINPEPPAPPSAQLLTAFPYLPPSITTCALPACVVVKSNPDDIKACKHDVESLLRASGLYSYEWLRQERLSWHPDRFGRLCEESWREMGRKMAEEMFKIIDALMEELRGAEG
ncbi:hypothetical protein P153DRAFT_300600 [Dothidotthia symphoricarpi CBS 119687]|uniref:Uncharacterized protein n=1 Tax=Dothidotthia symphoricarpi CBS 119687 TaxID=1392245 RepID=A0A6A6A2Q7_9PLEO|nr:uncharacterized protein P153DRAFT_300600 [Dothidotthia symphoricarpi CBS 119687]KAF2125018.1 hypothetical protein P153DRAFT_300600 [Dothidotthia symphoricarpi CBS 119687]